MTLRSSDPDAYALQAAALILIGHLQDDGCFVPELLPVRVRTEHVRADLSILLALNPDIEPPERDAINEEALKLMAALATDHDYSDDNEDQLRALLAAVPFAWPNFTVPHPHEPETWPQP